jgi:hypothetical protein
VFYSAVFFSNWLALYLNLTNSFVTETGNDPRLIKMQASSQLLSVDQHKSYLCSLSELLSIVFSDQDRKRALPKLS